MVSFLRFNWGLLLWDGALAGRLCSPCTEEYTNVYQVLTCPMNFARIRSTCAYRRQPGREPVLRKILSYAILLSVLFWIVLSYVPASLVPLPDLAILPAGVNPLFRSLSVISLVLFVAIQTWIVRGTLQVLRPLDRRRSLAHDEFRLSRSREFIWSAIPVVMTLILALASLPTWRSLSVP